jgi:hypothetical protein
MAAFVFGAMLDGETDLERVELAFVVDLDDAIQRLRR